MIGDRNVFVVRQQWIVGAEHAARIGGVKNRGEEIGKIADLRRHRKLCFAKRRQMALDAAAPLGRIALVAPTLDDARAVMIEGESGILTISPDWFRPTFEPSRRRLVWPNGAIATLFSAAVHGEPFCPMPLQID